MKYVKIRWKLKRFFQFTRHESRMMLSLSIPADLCVVFVHQLRKKIERKRRRNKEVRREFKTREKWNRPKRVKGIKKNKVENGKSPSPVCLASTLYFSYNRVFFKSFRKQKKNIAVSMMEQNKRSPQPQMRNHVFAFSSVHRSLLFLLATEWKAIIHCCLTIIEMNLN